MRAGRGDVFYFAKGCKIIFRTEKGAVAWYCGQRGSMFSLVPAPPALLADVCWFRGYGVDDDFAIRRR